MFALQGPGRETAAEVEIRGIYGQTGLGFFKLVVALDFFSHRHAEDRPGQISEISGQLSVKAANQTQPIGRLHPLDPRTIIDLAQVTANIQWSRGDAMLAISVLSAILNADS